MRIALICTLALTLLCVGGIAVAQQPKSSAPSLPAIDDASLAALKPIIAQRNALQAQLADVFAQLRIAQQAALAAANPPLDPLYYGVDQTGTKFAQIRALPGQTGSPLVR